MLIHYCKYLRSGRPLALALMILASLASSPAAFASVEDRVALVIGNADYQNISPLKNPVNDARAISRKLGELGFAVTTVENASGREMNRAISDWLGSTRAGQTALVYFAGHGVEVKGRNYLLPVDVPHLRLGQERELRREGIVLDDLLADILSSAALRGIVILDACRDNPLSHGTRSVGATRGMARVDNPYGTFVLYAAGARQAALDEARDDEANGLFTRSLLKHLDDPKLELRRLARKVREDVESTARNRFGHVQIPSYYDQMRGDFFFHRQASLQSAPAVVPQASAPPKPQPAQPPKPQPELVAKPWTVQQIAKSLDQSTLRLANGDTIFFSSKLKTVLTQKLGENFLKTRVRKDVLIQIPFLARGATAQGGKKLFEGVAGITPGRGQTGPVMVLFETTSKDTSFKRFRRQDRLFASLRLRSMGKVVECTRSPWQGLRTFKPPLKVSTSVCEVAKGNRIASE